MKGNIMSITTILLLASFNNQTTNIIIIALPLAILAIIITILIIRNINEKKYKEFEDIVLKELNLASWNIINFSDSDVTVKSRQALDKYDDIKFFKEDAERLDRAEKTTKRKKEVSNLLNNYIKNNKHKDHPKYNRLLSQINTVLYNAKTYRIRVTYISQAGNNLGSKTIEISPYRINQLKNDPSLLMTKGEYTKYLKELEKEALSKKQHEYYERVNAIIDTANNSKDTFIIKGSAEKLDNLIAQLFDRTVNSIKKIKATNSEEWTVIRNLIDHIDSEMQSIIDKNKQILEYYESDDFAKIKETCEGLMSTQREFNEYINEKIEVVSHLFGTRIVRDETVNEDTYDYIRPYKKTITPFTAEVSAAVFASAENNPLDYVVKNFYPNKQKYPEQIQKLQLFIEELETLKEAKQIIENYKAEYQQYLKDVPDYVMLNDEAGFYSRLGFANIDESVLTVEYRFSYTSGGGKAQRSFPVPMTEDTIVELINALESKLTASYFAKEQRTLMTKKLREFIKERDHFTCCSCGNSTNAEPNLLLEIDHIIPVSKGGYTVEENLQTLCWKCNRAKSNKIQ